MNPGLHNVRLYVPLGAPRIPLRGLRALLTLEEKPERGPIPKDYKGVLDLGFHY